ncbi:MAG: pilus assembly protein N-terminal domain-containing protein, partial [Candidatus Omnitrophota bacterium]|nr:pilus assembly protein N-terminal domain-containing protein [Candidatus Omnitrophota bacterium]
MGCAVMGAGPLSEWRTELTVLSVAVCWAGVAAGVDAQETDAFGRASKRVLELVVGERQRLSVAGIQRVLVGHPELLDVQRVGSDTVVLRPTAAGRTFLHLWGAEGRVSHSVRILPVRPLMVAREAAIHEAVEHAKALTVGYQVNYELTHQGPTLSETDLTTTTIFRHVITHQLETPVGETSSRVEFQRVNAFEDLATWWVRLADGHLGPLQDLRLTAGDATLPFGQGSFAAPPFSYRGATLDYQGLAPWRVAAAWGQERVGTFGRPTTGFDADRDAFLSGVHLGFDPPASWWSGSATALLGFGEDRGVTQSSQVVDLRGHLKLREPWSVDHELAVSEQAVGYTIGSSWHAPHQAVRLSYRDVAEEFQTILGPSADQGERGLLLEARRRITEQLSLRGRADLFQTRFLENPAEPGAFNLDADLDVDWRPWDQTQLSSFVSRQRLLGTLAPSDTLRMGTSLIQRLPAGVVVPGVRNIALSGRVEHQETRNVTSPSLDTDQEVLSLGLFVPLFWGFSANVGHQWHFLEETLTGARTRPRRFTTGLTHVSSPGGGRWRLRGRFAYEEESGTQSVRSILVGQDRVVWEAGMDYRPSSSVEGFVDGRLEMVHPEREAADRVEMAIFT